MTTGSETDTDQLADAINRHLTEAEISERELARRADLSNQTVNRLRQAQGQPKLATIRSIAAAINVEPSDLI